MAIKINGYQKSVWLSKFKNKITRNFPGSLSGIPGSPGHKPK